MSSREFYFALTVHEAQVSTALVRDLVARVCAVCAAPDRTVELTRQIEEAVGRSIGHGDCELCFRAHNGALDVAVRAGARQIWQTSRSTD